MLLKLTAYSRYNFNIPHIQDLRSVIPQRKDII